MKKILISIFAIAMSVAAYSQTPVPGGAISGTWDTAGSPYLIEGLTFVPNGSTLTIEPGVEVEWQGSYTMYIEGQILAIGTESDTILFTAADPETGFKSIRFIDTDPANDTSRFKYCIFEYGNVYGNYPDNAGGAVAIFGFSKVVFDHCLFRNNKTVEPHEFPENSAGGAIALLTSSPDIKNCTFINNNAYVGGAILCFTESNPLILSNTFTKNRAIETETGQGYGGAICAYIDSDPVISGNTFSENHARNCGGALAFVSACNPVIDHNLFCNDTAGIWGGAIELQDSCMAEIINNTIAYNHASLSAGGIDILDYSLANITNSILWGNTAPFSSQINLTHVTDKLNISYSCIMDGQAGIGGEGHVGVWEENIEDDPLFEDLVNYYLTSYSPCVDAGDPDTSHNDDEDPQNPGSAWYPSHGGLRNDMGAYGGHLFIHDILPFVEDQIKPGHSGLSDLGLRIYPNPTEDISHFTFLISQGQFVTLRIYDIYGKQVLTLVKEMKSPGEYTVRMDVSGLPAGVYFIRLQAGGKSAVRKLVVR